MRNTIYNILAIMWFFGVVLGSLVSLFVILLGIFFGDIVSMLQSGFSGSTIGFVFMFIFSLIFSVTGLVAPFRRCYYKLPWLYPLAMILLMHLGILSISEVILAKGFQVMGSTRHTITIIIMVLQMIACRAAMCVYLKKRPMD